VILKQFTARDVISKWDVIEAKATATSKTGKEFLDTVQRNMPFNIRAIQVDGGSEFYSEFEQECQRTGIKLFVLPQSSMDALREHREPIQRNSMRSMIVLGLSLN